VRFFFHFHRIFECAFFQGLDLWPPPRRRSTRCSVDSEERRACTQGADWLSGAYAESGRQGRRQAAQSQAAGFMLLRTLLDVVVGECTAILELLSGEDQALLVRRDALLVLNLRLNVVNRVRGLHLKGDRLTCVVPLPDKPSVRRSACPQLTRSAGSGMISSAAASGDATHPSGS